MATPDAPKGTCDDCGKSYRVPSADRIYRCKSCGGVVRCASDPAPDSTVDEAPEARVSTRSGSKRGARSDPAPSTHRRDTPELLKARAAADSARNLLTSFAILFLLVPILIGILLWKIAGAGYSTSIEVWAVMVVLVMIYIAISGLLLFAAFGARRRLTLGVGLAGGAQFALLAFAWFGGWRPVGLINWVLVAMAALSLLLLPIALRVDRLRKRFPDLRTSGSGSHAQRSDGRNAQGALLGFAACTAIAGAGFYRAFPEGDLRSSNLANSLDGGGLAPSLERNIQAVLGVDGFEDTFKLLWDETDLKGLYAIAARGTAGEELLDAFMEAEGFNLLPRSRTCLYELHGAGGPKQLLLDTNTGRVEVDIVVEDGLVAWTGIRMRS